MVLITGSKDIERFGFGDRRRKPEGGSRERDKLN
jgi:hypothetical protein